MKSNVSIALAFFAGMSIGASVTCLYLKNKYDKLAQEEIEAVRDFYKEKESSTTEISKHFEEKVKPVAAPDVDYSEYNQILGKYTTTPIAEDTTPGVSQFKEDVGEHPYVISPDEFGEFEDYTCISLTYYADQILADNDDELVDDIDSTVGIESLSHFGEYEDDSVFVRNDALKCDYEILLDTRKFSDVITLRPLSD